MWLKPRDIPYSSGFYAVMHTDGWSGGGTHLHLRANTSLLNCDFNSGPDVTSTTVLQQDEWYHAVVTVTDQGGGASQMYINGIVENEATGGSGPDIVLDTAGSASSLALALELVRSQGKVILYGIYGIPEQPVNVDMITLKDLRVYGALSDRVGWQDMIRWVADGSLNLKEIITHRFPLREAQKAYEIIRDRSEGAIKAVLFP